MRIHVAYRPNPVFYGEDAGFFHGDFVYDLDKLRAFVAGDFKDEFGPWTYSDDEAASIIRAVKINSPYDLEKHDKYTFYDTPDERKVVLSDDQNINTADVSITVLLHS